MYATLTRKSSVQQETISGWIALKFPLPGTFNLLSSLYGRFLSIRAYTCLMGK
jgi:hypothetical protein